MRIVGIVPEDAPDPRQELIARLRQMPVSILGLAPQPHVEDWGGFGAQASERNGAIEQMSALLTYTLWRNPDDPTDPANLAELNKDTRAALDTSPPWSRPRWLLEGGERMRYPTLWEAVRTTWTSPDEARRRKSVEAELVWHANYVLMNRFPQPGQRSVPPWERTEGRVDERHVEHGTPVTIDGEPLARRSHRHRPECVGGRSRPRAERRAHGSDRARAPALRDLGVRAAASRRLNNLHAVEGRGVAWIRDDSDSSPSSARHRLRGRPGGRRRRRPPARAVRHCGVAADSVDHRRPRRCGRRGRHRPPRAVGRLPARHRWGRTARQRRLLRARPHPAGRPRQRGGSGVAS